MSEYVFNASALGLGAVLNSGDVKTTIPSLASVALPPTGGEGSSVVENYNQHGVAFTHAESRVFGTQQSEGVYSTYADVYITNLSIRKKLKIALMSATVTSTRDLKHNESQFDVRLTYRGISVDDVEVIPVLDVDLCNNAPTYEQLVGTLRRSLPRYAKQFAVKENELEAAIKNPNSLEPLYGTLVSDYEFRGGKIERAGSAITVPEVGLAFFGEFLFKPGRRRVNLLRIKFFGDSPTFDTLAAAGGGGGAGDGGDLTGGSVEGNGTPPIPPRG